MQKKRWLVLAGAVAALFSLAVLVAACGGGDGDGEPTATSVATEPAAGEPTATEPADVTSAEGVTVDVSHVEWAVNLSVDTVAAGTVSFNVTNDGTIVHNFRIAKTDLAPDALPVDDQTFTVDEEEAGVLAGTDDLGVGESEVVSLDLEPGSYVLFCNIPTHYEVGTYTSFTVE